MKHAVDDTYYCLRFTPRKPKSTWAATNKARVKRLLAAGAMTAAGFAAIALAKKNGSWTTLDSAEALEMPTDLQKALNANAAAKEHWPLFTESQRKQFLYRLSSAKRQDTRAERLAQIVEMAEKKVTPQMAHDARRAAKNTKTG